MPSTKFSRKNQKENLKKRRPTEDDNERSMNLKKRKKNANEEEELEVVPKETKAMTKRNMQESESSSEEEDLPTLHSNTKKSNSKSKKSSGFQSLNLSQPLFKAILHKGYKVPTPIQRKSMPVILEGRDVVAMARTGSGKTAAFVIPMVERLKEHDIRVGARAIILSPSRELASQTLKFVKDLTKYTNLRSCMLVGGDSMEEQFAAIASNPDIIVATPGRLMHLCVEMGKGLELGRCEYLVFDEADRLFEMGFAPQLHEIIHRLPTSRQTLLFSATLPKLLIDFTRAGLTDPVLIRLDVETKLPSDLEMIFFNVKKEMKEAALLYTLKYLIPRNEMTIVFVATKHHVEYVYGLLTAGGISTTYIYGSLDQQARLNHLTLFKNRKRSVLVVTDVAARGIDIPLLDNVINYDFPGESKVFVHRVGRVARAGRKGTAYSFVSTEEVPYLFDFSLFSGRPLHIQTTDLESNKSEIDYTKELILGTLPQDKLDDEKEHALHLVSLDVTLQNHLQTSQNAYKLYTKTRPLASKESHTRSKSLQDTFISLHPLLKQKKMIGDDEQKRVEMLKAISGFRPQETVFEVINKKGIKDERALLMMKRRMEVGGVIEKRRQEGKKQETKTMDVDEEEGLNMVELEMASEELIQQVFGGDKEQTPTDQPQDDDEEKSTQPDNQTQTNKVKSETNSKGKKSKKETLPSFRDSEFYIPSIPADHNTERGYSLSTSSFLESASKASLSIQGDDATQLMRQKGQLKWDKKKRKFVKDQIGSDNVKRIRTDSGLLVSASYKTNKFNEWKSKTKLSLPRSGETELPSSSIPQLSNNAALGTKRFKHTKTFEADPNSKNTKRKQSAAAKKEGVEMVQTKKGKKVPIRNVGAKAKSELKSRDEIVKQRKLKEKRREKNARTKKGKGRR